MKQHDWQDSFLDELQINKNNLLIFKIQHLHNLLI
jgi:hypothetical protein